MDESSFLGVVKLEDPGTWRPFHKNLCNTCSAGCCTLIVEVTGEDLVTLGYAALWDLQHGIKKLIKTLKKEGIIKRYNFKSGMFTLEQKSGGECIFLDESRQCLVYERRPRVCREHPVKAGPRNGYCAYRPVKTG